MAKFRSVRASRIRYDDSATIRRRRAAKLADRDRANGNYVLGHLVMSAGCIVLQAIEQHPAWAEIETLTESPARMRLWRTKQAARQWLQRRPRLELHCLQVNNLDVRQEEHAGSTLPAGQRIPAATACELPRGKHTRHDEAAAFPSGQRRRGANRVLLPAGQPAGGHAPGTLPSGKPRAAGDRRCQQGNTRSQIALDFPAAAGHT